VEAQAGGVGLEVARQDGPEQPAAGDEARAIGGEVKPFGPLPFILGEGREEESLRTLVCELGLERNVLFLGSRHDVPDILRLCSAGILYSRSEGLGVAAIEMLATGLPVLGSDVPGIREVVSEETGVLVPLDGPARLAASVSALLDDDTKRISMGRAARMRAVEVFSLSTQVAKHETLYAAKAAELRMDGRRKLRGGEHDPGERKPRWAA